MEDLILEVLGCSGYRAPLLVVLTVAHGRLQQTTASLAHSCLKCAKEAASHCTTTKQAKRDKQPASCRDTGQKQECASMQKQAAFRQQKKAQNPDQNGGG